MNILGNKVENLNKIKKMAEDNLMLQEEYDKMLEQYYMLYYKLREKEDNHILRRLTVKQRQKIYKYILRLFCLLNKIEGFNSNLLYDKSSPTDRPILFVPTHVGKHDIEIIANYIKKHFVLLSGDFEHIQGKIEGAFLRLVGVEYFNERVKKDRNSIPKRIGEHLNKKDNVMWFIEGIWNMTPEKPMLPPYWGIVDVAKKHNAIISPIGIDQYGKQFEVAIGENFDMSLYGEDVSEKIRAISDLRDVLSTLKYDIWESRGIYRRNEIDEKEWQKYVEERFLEWKGFDLEYIESLIYKPKGIIEPEKAYSEIKKLLPKKENAFLFDKRNAGNMKIIVNFLVD